MLAEAAADVALATSEAVVVDMAQVVRFGGEARADGARRIRGSGKEGVRGGPSPSTPAPAWFGVCTYACTTSTALSSCSTGRTGGRRRRKGVEGLIETNATTRGRGDERGVQARSAVCRASPASPVSRASAAVAVRARSKGVRNGQVAPPSHCAVEMVRPTTTTTTTKWNGCASFCSERVHGTEGE